MEKTKYPLCWPFNWPKVEPSKREVSKFKCTLHGALARLEKEIKLLGGTGLILSSNYTLGSSNPLEPGVVAYFQFEKTDMAIPCDRWKRIEDNVHAIALTVEAMRGMERWGAKHMIKALFTGFKMLPEKTGGLSWWTVLGISVNANEEQIKTAYRELAKQHHPDKGGQNGQWLEIQQAYSMALSQLPNA